jgi:PAS domain S-box-containing protein
MYSGRIYIFVAAGLLIFLLDSLIPIGYGVWLLYIILFYISIRYSDKNQITALAVVYTILIYIGYFLSPENNDMRYAPIINRFAATLVIIFVSVLSIKEKEAKKLSTELLERIKDLFISLDKKLRIIFMNRSAHEFSGKSEMVSGASFSEVFPVDGNSLFEDSFKKALTSQEAVHFEGAIPQTGNYLTVSVYPSEKGLSVFAKDITDSVKYQNDLKKLVDEKEILLREIHHRTKNNFQLVLSLLNLQLNSIDDKLSSRILNETRTRILSIASLYDRLNFSRGSYSVDLSQFISEIVVKMDTAANFGIIKLDNELEIDSIQLNPDTAIPIGLMINELYTNSLKYAFNGSRRGAIKIKIHVTEGNILHIHYKDNGKGLPADFNIETSGGLGSSIITSFVEQLEGTISYCNNNGAEFNIVLKIADINQA